jgi:molybdate transport system substrate-binding protein
MFLLRIPLLALLTCLSASAETIRVGVAISLKDAMTEIASGYEQASGDRLQFTFGSSGQLQAQIKNGADIDAFISAANKQVEDLTKEGLAVAETRRIVAGNTVVLVVPADAAEALSGFESLTDAKVKRVAIGEPTTVPAGQYAMQVLQSLGIADKLTSRIVYGANVRQVLNYVERGEVAAGIVYATDAIESGDKVRVVATAKAGSHDSVVYPAIVIRSSAKQQAAQRFLDYLATDKAEAVLVRKGFAIGAGAGKKPPG